MKTEQIKRWIAPAAISLISGVAAAFATWLAGYALADSIRDGEVGLGLAMLFAYFIAPGVGLTVAIAVAVVLRPRSE